MTPLVMELLEDLYSKIYFRATDAIDGMRDERLRSVLWTCAHQCKFFDCSEVMQVASHLALPMFEAFEENDRIDQRLAFLPAEWTWLEIENPGFRDQLNEDEMPPINEVGTAKRQWNYTYRTAFVMIAQHGVTNMVNRRLQISYETPRPKDTPRIWRITELPPLPLVHSGLKPQRYSEIKSVNGDVRKFGKPTARIDDFIHYALLALINTPRVIGQRTHWPHERLEREKLKKLNLVGKFPLRAWTEIILKIAQQDNRTGEPSEEHHLTGERCLHFCRTYLRVRLGMIEYVEGHWRGNPALGMKRSRYRVEK